MSQVVNDLLSFQNIYRLLLAMMQDKKKMYLTTKEIARLQLENQNLHKYIDCIWEHPNSLDTICICANEGRPESGCKYAEEVDDNAHYYCQICDEYVCSNCSNATKCTSCGFVTCVKCDFDEDYKENSSCSACSASNNFWARVTTKA